MIRKSRLLFVFIIVLLVVLLSLPLPISRKIKITLVEFLSPVAEVFNYIGGKILSIGDLFTAVKENNILRGQAELLSQQLCQYRELAAENKRLEQLLDLREHTSYPTIACRVIARDAGSWYRTVVINKGKEDGIDKGMPVLSPGGLIGRVIESDDSISRVLLITDINSSIGGMLQGTRTVGLVDGEGGNTCIFTLIPRQARIQIGGRVVTSGLGQVFPKGLMIGAVVKVSSGRQDLCQRAELRLAADIDRIEEVLVVKEIKKGS